MSGAKVVVPIALAGAALLIGAGVLAARGCMRLADGPEGGVVVGMPLPPHAVAALMKHQLLEPGERPLAYYDATISLDGSDLSVLTNRRVIRLEEGRKTAWPWSEVTAVDHANDGLGADVFTFHHRTGALLVVRVDALNHGDLFQTALDEARKAHP